VKISHRLALIVLLLPGVLLAWGGYLHFENGKEYEAAYPVPIDLALGIELPKEAYAYALKRLGRTTPNDGIAQISYAETMSRLGISTIEVAAVAATGISGAPANAEGWLIYAEALAKRRPPKAAQALSMAFTLSRYQYFNVRRRVLLANALWEYLDRDTRLSAVSGVRRLWQEPLLRDELILLLRDSDGKLVTAAFSEDPDTLRALNRWVAARRRTLQSDTRH
jgi:hypothetical protein